MQIIVQSSIQFNFSHEITVITHMFKKGEKHGAIKISKK